MKTIKVQKGSKLVIATSNGEGFGWSSRLYVNGGETATLISAKHKSEAGVRRWASKVLEA